MKNNNNKLLVLAFFCSIVGLAILYVLANSMEPLEVQAWELDGHPGETVRVSGLVERISVSVNGTVFLTFSGAESLFFQRQAQKLPELITLKKGDYVCVVGRVSSYMGRTELMGERLC